MMEMVFEPQVSNANNDNKTAGANTANNNGNNSNSNDNEEEVSEPSGQASTSIDPPFESFIIQA